MDGTGSQKAPTSQNEVQNEVKNIVRQLDMEKLQEQLRGKSVRVGRIAIKGLDKTKADLIEREAAILDEVTTFAELEEKSQQLHVALSELNIFKAHAIELHPSHLGQSDVCDVVIKVKEKRVMYGKGALTLEGTNGNAEVRIGASNALGSAEKIELDLNYSQPVTQRASSNYEAGLRLKKPRINASRVDVDVELSRTINDNAKVSSFVEERNVSQATASWLDDSYNSHVLNYELGWQKIRPPGGELLPGFTTVFGLNTRRMERGEARQKPSHAVGQQMGDLWKSALKYHFTRDTLNDFIFPTSGYGFRSVTEVAGLWPDARALRHVKQEVRAEAVKGLGEGLAIALSYDGGLLLPWGSNFWDKTTNLPARFSAGGISYGIRGFKAKSIGATAPCPPVKGLAEKRDYLGGDLYQALSLALRVKSNAVGLPDFGAYLQIFGTVCNNMLLSGQGKPYKEQLQTFVQDRKFSLGAGLVVPTTQGVSIEAGFAYSSRNKDLDWRETDFWKKGFFCGLSLSF